MSLCCPNERWSAETAGFVGGFAVSLLGGIMLLLGFTGAFASTLPPPYPTRHLTSQLCSQSARSSRLSGLASSCELHLHDS